MGVRLAVLIGSTAVTLAASACGEDASRAAREHGGAALSGTIRVDGAKTVSPLTKAIARRFEAAHPGARVAVGRAGDARGFARFCHGETDLADASAPIEAKAIDACEAGGVRWSRVTVADDAVVLVVNRGNPVRCLTTDQLAQIWRGNSNVTERWSQIGGLTPPYDEELVAWGPGIDTETFAFFTLAVNRERDVTRDYNNALHRNGNALRNVGGSPGAIGYAAWALYRRDVAPVRLLAVDSGDGCVRPSPRTIADGSYRPFSRRLFVYVSADALARPEVQAFLRSYLRQAQSVARRAGFVPLTGDQLAASKANLERLIARASD